MNRACFCFEQSWLRKSHTMLSLHQMANFPKLSIGCLTRTMAVPTNEQLSSLLALAQPLRGSPSDFDAVLSTVRSRDASFVLIGEASHGTHEFYKIRAEITKRLITEDGFVAVCAESDWPDAARVNRYVKGRNGKGDRDAEEAMSGEVFA